MRLLYSSPRKRRRGNAPHKRNRPNGRLTFGWDCRRQIL